MCTTDLARRGLKPTMGVEEEEVINVFVILIIILILIVGMLSILHYIIILIRRVTQWLHVPRGPDKNVPTIFWDFQPLRELLQHAWHGLQSTPGDLSFLRLQYFLHSFIFYLFFAPLHILTSLYVIIPGQGFFNDGHTDGMDTDDPFAGWVPPHIAFWQLCLWALPSFK